MTRIDEIRIRLSHNEFIGPKDIEYLLWKVSRLTHGMVAANNYLTSEQVKAVNEAMDEYVPIPAEYKREMYGIAEPEEAE